MTQDTLIQINNPSQTRKIMNMKQEKTQKASIQTIEPTRTATKIIYDKKRIKKVPL